MSRQSIFTVGGTVQAGKGLYIQRHADEELLSLCRNSSFAYVLTARQMGKSSLMVSTSRRLEQEGIQSVIIDLTQIGTRVTAEEWYLGLLSIIVEHLTPEIDIVHWWNRHAHLGFTQRLTQFFERVLCAELKSRVIIFVDEIDTTLSLDFTDDFYAAIRYLYNARSHNIELRRISFVLIGVATPNDLIHDRQRTPFNIGEGVHLEDFTREEINVFIPSLNSLGCDPNSLLNAIFAWTDGHPYMTQCICRELESQGYQNALTEEERVEKIVNHLFLGREQGAEVSLATTDGYFRQNASNLQQGLEQSKPPWWLQRRSQMLQIYRRLINGERVVTSSSDPAQRALRLTGIAAERNDIIGGYLQVRNRIYNKIFDRAWLKEREATNLISEAVGRWIDNGRRHDDVLRGQTLEEALVWASGQANLTFDEQQFLLVSQQVTNEEALKLTEIHDFNQSLLNSMLHSLMVIDCEGTIQFVNERLLQTFGRSRDSLKKQNFEVVIGHGPSRHHQLRPLFAEIIESGQPYEVPEVHVWSPEGTMIFDLRCFRVFFRGQAEVAILLINLTHRWRKTYQLQLMHEISRLFQESLVVDRVLFTALTCVTAGNALGFNRAFVFLFDETSNRLSGRMAIGPASAEEAMQIWAELTERDLTLTDLLSRADFTSSQLHRYTISLKIGRDNKCFPALQEAIESNTAILADQKSFIDYGGSDSQLDHQEAFILEELFKAKEMAIAPLVARAQLLGVIFADNLFTGAPIEIDDIQLLDTLAQVAGLSLENAETFEALQKAQKELVSAERLVAVGEMAARVSHEIRNPLATIGGFARSVLKKPEDSASVKRKTRVVVDEVDRLEELLTDLLDLARPRPPEFKEHRVNELIEQTLLLVGDDLNRSRTQVVRKLSPNLPLFEVDRSRILQALFNVFRNAIQAMKEDGILTISTLMSQNDKMIEINIADTGTGIPERAIRQIFDPFFSTRESGSGLGLAVTKRIISEHGGQITVESKEGAGTKFTFSLPLHH